MAKQSTPHLESAEVLDKELKYVMKTFDDMNRSQGRQHAEIEALASTHQELQKTYRDLRGALDVQLIETRYHGIEIDDLQRDIELRRQSTRSSVLRSPPKRQKSGGAGAMSGVMSGGDSTQRGHRSWPKFPRVRKFRGKNEEEVSSDEEEDDEEEIEIYRDHAQD